MKFLSYNVLTADDCGIKEHPQDYMNKYFKVIHSVPQSIADCWWFYIEDYECSELSKFLHEMKPYNLNYWKNGCIKIVTFLRRVLM